MPDDGIEMTIRLYADHVQNGPPVGIPMSHGDMRGTLRNAATEYLQQIDDCVPGDLPDASDLARLVLMYLDGEGVSPVAP